MTYSQITGQMFITQSGANVRVSVHEMEIALFGRHGMIAYQPSLPGYQCLLENDSKQFFHYWKRIVQLAFVLFADQQNLAILQCLNV